VTASVLLEAKGLVVNRRGTPVVRGASLVLRAGDAFALIGPNAAGKSTLLRALAGLLPAAGGEVLWRGRPLSTQGRSARARALALVTSEDEGAPLLTVRERVALGRYPHRGPLLPLTGADHAAVDQALRQTGIEALAGRALGTLSAGERQLAALARGLAQEPEVLLLDEPSAHLDIGHELGLFDVLDGVRRRGVAVLAVVHDLQRAAAWAGRMALLNRGEVVAEGPPAEVLSSASAREAFGVSIQGHAVPGSDQPLYRFALKPAPPR
jgi:iron complex transport system ATP-binding protein